MAHPLLAEPDLLARGHAPHGQEGRLSQAHMLALRVLTCGPTACVGLLQPCNADWTLGAHEEYTVTSVCTSPFPVDEQWTVQNDSGPGYQVCND